MKIWIKCPYCKKKIDITGTSLNIQIGIEIFMFLYGFLLGVLLCKFWWS